MSAKRMDLVDIELGLVVHNVRVEEAPIGGAGHDHGPVVCAARPAR